jgi:hypothetical protein
MRVQPFLVMAFALVGSGAEAQRAEPPPMKCETGPANRQIGGNSWLVYSCDDQRSMVAVAPADNPASPFYFVLRSDAGSYKIYGEGTGDKAASDAAGDELSRMNTGDLVVLMNETKHPPKVRFPP